MGLGAGCVLSSNLLLPKKVISRTNSTSEQRWINAQKPKLIFVVVSDIHIARLNAIKHFSALLIDNFNTKPDAMVVVGDLGDGLPRYYNMINYVLAEHSIEINYPIHWTIGNHEFYGAFHKNGLWSPKSLPNNETDALAIERFLAFAKRDKVYGDTFINDYHFIFLGSEKSRMSDRGYLDSAYLSDTQLNWLRNILDNDKKQNKPIFVFLHQPIPYSTLEGIERGFVIQWQKLNDILLQHPEIILFNGHTHYEIDYKYMESEANNTIINSSSLACPIDRNGKRILNSAPGLIVEVYDDKVIIKGREFLSQNWMSTAKITVPV